jgi:hypothetical protein
MKTTLQRATAVLLIVSMTGLGMPLPAQAGTVSTEEAAAIQRDRIAGMLDRSDVRAALEARGVTSSDAKARVEAMTDEEVAQLAHGIDAQPAGGHPLLLALGVLVYVPILAIAAVGGLIKLAVEGSKGSSRNTGKPQQDSTNDVSPFPSQG